MPEGKAIATQLLALTVAALVAQGAEKTTDNSSSKLMLSIYSYGGATPAIAPEVLGYNTSTGPLTDVVATPPLSSSFSKNPKPASPNSPLFPLTPLSPVAPSGTTDPLSAGGGAAAPPPLVPVPPVVTLGWDASPAPSVVGYQLYIGPASGQYETTQRVGNQTSASITLDRPVVYVAISALTDDGLQSPLSAELVVTANSYP